MEEEVDDTKSCVELATLSRKVLANMDNTLELLQQ